MILIVSSFFAVSGLAGFIWCLVMISRSIDSEGWPRTDCEVLESYVKEIVGEGTEYRAIVRYKYSVNGLPYEGNTVRFGKSSIQKSTAERICRKYREGATARVSFDPEKPERSVLIPGISPGVYVLLIIMTSWLLVGGKVIFEELFK